MKKQIQLLVIEIGELQSELLKEKNMESFEALRRKIDQLEFKRVQLLYPIENEKPLPTYKFLTK